jgi:CBS domain-containing protein
MNDIKVEEVMTNLVVTLRPDDGITEAARKLLANRISGAPVVQRGRLVGVISEADLVATYSHPARPGSTLRAMDPLAYLIHGSAPSTDSKLTVADVMTTDVITLSPTSSIWEAAALIERRGIRRLPIIDEEGFLVGIVARADLVRAMTLMKDVS